MPINGSRTRERSQRKGLATIEEHDSSLATSSQTERRSHRHDPQERNNENDNHETHTGKLQSPSYSNDKDVKGVGKHISPAATLSLPPARDMTLKQTEKETRQWHSRLRFRPGGTKADNRDKNKSVRSFSLEYNECSVDALSNWVNKDNSIHKTPTEGDRPHAPRDRRCIAVDVKFRKCSICQRLGHYELQCPRITREHKRAYASEIEKFRRRQSQQNTGQESDGVKRTSSVSGKRRRDAKSETGALPETTSQEIGGFMVEQSCRPLLTHSLENGKRQKKINEIPTDRNILVTKIDRVTIKAATSPSAFAEAPESPA